MSATLICHACQKANAVSGKVGFREDCMDCHADLHCCKNCQFYDPKVYNECRETAADVVREKDRNNYCDFFQPQQKANSVADEKEKLRAAAEALFAGLNPKK